MGNPLTSEAEAFKWLVAIAAFAAVIIAIALLTRPLLALIVGAVLLGAFAYRFARARDEVPVDHD